MAKPGSESKPVLRHPPAPLGSGGAFPSPGSSPPPPVLLLRGHPRCRSSPREQGEASSFHQPAASLPKASSCWLTRALPSPRLHWVLLGGSLGHPSHGSGPQPTREQQKMEAGLGSRPHTQPEDRTSGGHKHSSEQEERPRPDPKYIPSQWVRGCRF